MKQWQQPGHNSGRQENVDVFPSLFWRFVTPSFPNDCDRGKDNERDRHTVEHRPLGNQPAGYQIGPFDPARPHVGVILLHVPKKHEKGLAALSPITEKKQEAESAAEEKEEGCDERSSLGLGQPARETIKDADEGQG